MNLQDAACGVLVNESNWNYKSEGGKQKILNS